LSKIKTFLPEFIQNTEILLKDEKELKRKRIDNEENEEEMKKTKIFLKDLKPPSKFIYKTGTFQQATDIKMVNLCSFFKKFKVLWL